MTEIRFNAHPTYAEISALQLAGKLVALLTGSEPNMADARMCGVDVRHLLVGLNPDRDARWEICRQLAETGAVEVIFFD